MCDSTAKTETSGGGEPADVVSKDLFALYVWEEVLIDYTAGLVCAYARTEDEAWDKLKEADHTAWWCLRGSPDDRNDPRTANQLGEDATRPKRVDQPEAFVCWGGG